MKSERLIRALIRLYPPEFRARYQHELLEFHRERVRAGIPLSAWLRILADHFVSAGIERFRRSRPEHTPMRKSSLATLTQDLRYALRTLSRRPVFTAAVIAIIALGAGANTAIFSVVNAILLRPLPYPNPERVVSFGHQPPIWLASAPEYLDYKNGLRSFEGLSAYTEGEGNLSGADEPERVPLAAVTLNFFQVLGLGPTLGRPFAPEEDLTSPPSVVIISHALWQRRFAGDGEVVGKELVLNGQARTVIGVMPRNFDYPTARTDVWVPMRRMTPGGASDHRSNHSLFLVGRLRPGVTVERARSEALTFARRMVQQNAAFYDPKYPSVPVIEQVSENLVGSTRPYLWTLLGAVGFVLLIVCANIANLLLARGEGRRREMAVRSALGASRVRLLRQVLAEALLLALAGGVLGIGLAWLLDRALVLAAPSNIPRIDEIGINWGVLAYALTTSLLAGLSFGLVPALRASREAPAETLKQSGRSEHQGSSRRMRRSLVVAEVALAVVLLTGAGMLLQSLRNLQSNDLGFDTRSTLTAKVSLTQASYPNEKAIVFFSELLARVRALPGVQHAGAAGWLPVVQAGGLWGVLAEGQSYETIEQGPMAVPQQATPGYFASIGIPLLAGRDFHDQDGAAGPYVAVISQAMAKQLWPNEPALGKRFRLGGGNTLMTVVGIVGDIRARGFTDTPEPTMYFPYAQTSVSSYFQPRSLSLVVRTKGDAGQLEGQVRALVRSLDASVPISDVRTLEQVVGTSTAQRRFSTALIGAFAALALLLAGIGIFGVISYGVSERSYEIGVRMALGAERRQAMALVAGDSLRMAGAGVLLGVLGSVAVARTIRSLLVGVQTVDVPTLVAVCTLLMLVVLLASAVPARRAMSVDPAAALKGN
jgi:putative ABC transport system permease protein